MPRDPEHPNSIRSERQELSGADRTCPHPRRSAPGLTRREQLEAAAALGLVTAFALTVLYGLTLLASWGAL